MVKQLNKKFLKKWDIYNKEKMEEENRSGIRIATGNRQLNWWAFLSFKKF